MTKEGYVKANKQHKLVIHHNNTSQIDFPASDS